MSVYGHTPSPLKPFSKSSLAFNSNQTATGLKRNLEREYSHESPDRQQVASTNIESQYWRRKSNLTDAKHSKVDDKGRKIIELEQKIDVILRHNTHLLAENSALKETAAGQQMEIEALRHELQTVMLELRQPSYDRLLMTEQLDRKNYEHRIEVEKLLNEISKLHEDCFQVETAKNMEIQRLKNEYQQASYNQIQNLKRSQHGNNEMYELQIRRLRDSLDSKIGEIEEAAMLNKREKEVLLEQLASLKSDYKHTLQRKQQEIEELKAQSEFELNKALREHRINEDSIKGAHELALKKLRKELNDRAIDIERLNNKIGNSSEENEFLSKQLREERDRLNGELERLGEEYKQQLAEEKVRLERLSEVELGNLEKAGDNKVHILENQIRKLMDLLESKNQRLTQQTKVSEKAREVFTEQLAYMESQNKALREKLWEINQNSLQEIELIKVKMAQLHEADIQALVTLYEQKLESLSEEVSRKTKLIEDLRNDVHKEMQARLHLRKEYELQLSKLRSIVLDLKIQLAAVHVEMKENLTSLRSKIDVASQSFIADRDLKNKNMKFYEEEMRKLRQTIEAKDTEISLIQDNSDKKKQFYEDEVARLGEKNVALKKEMEDKEDRKNKDIAAKNAQIDSLKLSLQQEKNALEEEIASHKDRHTTNQSEVRNLESTIQKLEKQILQWEEKYKKIEHELALAHGHMETFRMESEVNINDEKEKHKSAAKSAHDSLKDFYERKIKELEEDKKELQRINTTQSEQISELVARYNALERNLKQLLESQKRLTDFETRVVNLGLDQNLIKNMSELLRRN